MPAPVLKSVHVWERTLTEPVPNPAQLCRTWTELTDAGSVFVCWAASLGGWEQDWSPLPHWSCISSAFLLNLKTPNLSPPPRYRLVQPPLSTHHMCARRPPHTAQTPRQQRTETIPAKSCWGVMAVEADARNGQKCSSFHLVFHGETIFPPQRCSSDELQAHKGPFLCFSGMIRLGKNTAFPHHSCFNYPQCSSALLQSKFPNTDGKSKSILKLSVFQVKKDFQRRCVKFLKLLCLFYIKYFSVCPKFQCSLWDFIYSVWEGFYAFLCGSSFKNWTFTY